MFDYLQKFNSLKESLKSKVSSPEAIAIIDALEKKYSVDLAPTIMKVMVKEVEFDSLSLYLAENFEMDSPMAESLVDELKNKVFVGLEKYLEIEGNHENTENTKIQKHEKIRQTTDDGRLTESSSILPSAPKKTTGADFFFSAEDEEEIKEVAEKIDGYEKFNENHVDEKVDRLIKEVNIGFGSQELINRFKKALATHIRGIRDRIDTKEVLMRKAENGGLELDEDTSYNVLSKAEKYILEKKKEEEDLTTKQVNPRKTKLDNIINQADYNLASELEKIHATKNDEEKINGNLDLERELAPPPPVVENNTSTQPKIEEEKATSKKGEKEIDDVINEFDLEHELTPPPPKIVKAEAKIPAVKKEKPIFSHPKLAPVGNALKNESQDIAKINIKRHVEDSSKTRMDDIKTVPRVMGPIDEFKYMKLDNFHRLSMDPKEAVEKIREKLDFLGDGHYGDKIKGIKAWRQSPVNKLYLEIGHESIEKSKPVAEIIAERKGDADRYLSQEEFDAIMDLNKKLRF